MLSGRTVCCLVSCKVSTHNYLVLFCCVFECIQHCKDVVWFNYNKLLFLVLINKILHNTKKNHNTHTDVSLAPPYPQMTLKVFMHLFVFVFENTACLSIQCMPQSKVWWVTTENTVCRLFEIISGTRWVDTDCQHSECHLMSDLYFKICLVKKVAIYSRE